MGQQKQNGKKSKDILDILVIENDDAIIKMIEDVFSQHKKRFKLRNEKYLQQARQSLTKTVPDFILADYLLPDGWGIEFLSGKKEQIRVPLVVLIQQGEESIGLKAIKAGALDYVIKDESSLKELPRIIEKGIREAETIQKLKETEKELRASLKERDTILREIHHRVKNNFQVVCSVLSLQSQHIKDDKLLDMLIEIQDRVRAMALIHEKLYQSEDAGRMDFAEYIQNLVHGLFWSYGTNPNQVELSVDVDDVLLDLDATVPCGLIINELVSNSLKHAFPASFNGNGEIQVALKDSGNGHVDLTVEDNGIGVPEDFDMKQSDSFGLELVTILAEDQLNGKASFERGEGVKFLVQFKRKK